MESPKAGVLYNSKKRRNDREEERCRAHLAFPPTDEEVLLLLALQLEGSGLLGLILVNLPNTGDEVDVLGTNVLSLVENLVSSPRGEEDRDSNVV